MPSGSGNASGLASPERVLRLNWASQACHEMAAPNAAVRFTNPDLWAARTLRRPAKHLSALETGLGDGEGDGVLVDIEIEIECNNVHGMVVSSHSRDESERLPRLGRGRSCGSAHPGNPRSQ